ncbi:hypothetical protein RF11_15404 [Thelohanellus kitauei]|uniref:Uncharacterized protein n=1 Tax=Thelohanellus kitauei TaxID=669202 RepID=A0A0C2MA64_THEKT|nr:hypothetical protein RF11_15404 [Thelohanellus kitauei]
MIQSMMINKIHRQMFLQHTWNRFNYNHPDRNLVATRDEEGQTAAKLLLTRFNSNFDELNERFTTLIGDSFISSLIILILAERSLFHSSRARKILKKISRKYAKEIMV